MPQVEIYTQPWCGFCARAINLMTTKGVAFEEIHAPHGSPERARAERLSGRSTMPQIFIGGASIGGCDDLLALDRSGRLDTMLTAG